MITEEERRLIDDAVSAGRVQKIPFAVSSEPDWKWSARQNKLVAYDPSTGKPMPPRWWVNRRFINHNAHRPPDPAVAARRERVAELARQGKTVPEIVEAVGTTEGSVRHDLCKMKVSAAKLIRPTKQTAPERIEKLKQYAAEGLTKQEAADRLGLSKTTVRKVLCAAGVELDWRMTDAQVKRFAGKKERLEQIPDLRRKGMNNRQIARHFGVSNPCIANDVRHLKREGVL